ncbi:hypothetical protein K469DRAFT_548226, partial [Zopfia rhizophila CBS 207.26]
YINKIFYSLLDNFYTTYLNNILIYFKDLLQYKEHIDIKKSEFTITRTKFLGLIISIKGI